MKYIAKMMLALLASVTLAIPAYAWDFSASGSASASLNSTTTKDSSADTTTATSGGVTSEGGALTLKSSHTDGDHSATFTYSTDWADGGLDQVIKVAGSKKVGKWTGSAETSFNLDAPGCYGADNGSSSTKQVTTCRETSQQTGEDRMAITVTDGTITIKLGEAAHLSNQNVSSNSVAAGAPSMDSADDDIGIGAFVGSFHGLSIGYKVSDTISGTFAYQKSSDANDLLGAQEYADSETAAYGTTGMGVSASIGAGPATIGVTVGNASTADSSGASGTLKTTHAVTGLGVKIDLGDIDPFISYGSNKTTNSGTGETETGGMELGLTYAMGSDSVVVYYGSLSEKSSATDKATVSTGIEVGYNTAIGPVALGVGYGSQTRADSDGAGDGDGYAMTDIEVKMTMSF